MRHPSAVRFALSSSAVALAAGVAAVPLVAPPTAGWAAFGWAVAAATGLVGGIALALRHGDPGHGFIAAVGGGLALRMLGFAAVVALAVRTGREALVAGLIGFGAAFVAVQLFEMIWFYRLTRAA